jgi:hypothetical protein
MFTCCNVGYILHNLPLKLLLILGLESDVQRKREREREKEAGHRCHPRIADLKKQHIELGGGGGIWGLSFSILKYLGEIPRIQIVVTALNIQHCSAKH